MSGVISDNLGRSSGLVKAAGGGGILIQQVASVTTSFATHTTVMPADDTIPQNTEGAEILTRAITPTNASNILEIFMFICMSSFVTAKKSQA